jgi:Domain of unknown function (DUF4430)
VSPARRLLALVAAGLSLAGCGLGPGAEREGGAELRVTRDFGREAIASKRIERVREDETVMRALRSRFDVSTRFGGRFVQSIGGVSGKGPGGRSDWFYFVNGIEASVGAAEYELSPGDVVQWDYRRWDAAMRVPAIVGAYPEPLLHGVKGERFPVRVECSDASSSACALVKQRLRGQGVKATGASLGAQGTRDVLRVVVAPWARARQLGSVSALDEGPSASGVFARFEDGGRRLELLDDGGHGARSQGAGAGLLAALAPAEDQIVWLVTGTDERGVGAAAHALRERPLRDAYAVAAGPGGVERLPLPAGERREG